MTGIRRLKRRPHSFSRGRRKIANSISSWCPHRQSIHTRPWTERQIRSTIPYTMMCETISMMTFMTIWWMICMTNIMTAFWRMLMTLFRTKSTVNRDLTSIRHGPALTPKFTVCCRNMAVGFMECARPSVRLFIKMTMILPQFWNGMTRRQRKKRRRIVRAIRCRRQTRQKSRMYRKHLRRMMRRSAPSSRKRWTATKHSSVNLWSLCSCFLMIPAIWPWWQSMPTTWANTQRPWRHWKT